MYITSEPGARRLITSLRDLGYSFADAIAEIVDNSIQARATVIQVRIAFRGSDSFIAVLDNGCGMSGAEIREALRFGTMRQYRANDLGKFGLGLKTASLSQCDCLTVSSRIAASRPRTTAYSWDMSHVEAADRWEITSVPTDALIGEVKEHHRDTIGTAVVWQGLNRLTNYRIPTNKRAEIEVLRLTTELELSLGSTFHRQLSGEGATNKVIIFVNGKRVQPWDPFCRTEEHTLKLPEFTIEVEHMKRIHEVRFAPYILPVSDKFSSPGAHARAGGLKKWNGQQGFYVYRSGRMLQAGGWCGLRTSDEHIKLARVSVDVPTALDECFRVNVSKMKIIFPGEIRDQTLSKLQETFKTADNIYRTDTIGSVTNLVSEDILNGKISNELRLELERIDALQSGSTAAFSSVIPRLLETASPHERRTLLRVLSKYVSRELDKAESERPSSETSVHHAA